MAPTSKPTMAKQGAKPLFPVSVQVHPQAICESVDVGAGTRIWAFAQVMAGAVLGRDCNVGGQTFIERGARIGDRVTIKNGVMIWDGVTIADDAFIGPGVIFTNDQHPRSPRMEEIGPRYRHPENWQSPTVVERGASLGAGAIIVCGITIGEFAMIGAGGVVTENVQPYQIVAGNPARPIGWTCVCGRSLDSSWVGDACGRRFELSGAQLKSVD